MVLARNNIVGNNLDVTLAIQNTKLDKSKVFDKILVSMVRNCVKSLDEKIVDEVLNTDNIVKLGSQHEKLLTFNPADVENTPEFDAEEIRLLNILYRVFY
jgi:hypothetical protein